MLCLSPAQSADFTGQDSGHCYTSLAQGPQTSDGPLVGPRRGFPLMSLKCIMEPTEQFIVLPSRGLHVLWPTRRLSQGG